MIQVDVMTLLMGTIPLWISFIASAWTMLRILVFKPLDEISRDLKVIKEVFSKHDERISLLEYKVNFMNKEFDKLVCKSNPKYNVEFFKK